MCVLMATIRCQYQWRVGYPGPMSMGEGGEWIENPGPMSRWVRGGERSTLYYVIYPMMHVMLPISPPVPLVKRMTDRRL